jgi:hypothetical protein
MRRLSFAVLLAALIVAVLPITAEANHTLAHKVRKLQGKVATLQAKVNCLRRTGVSTYLGYAYYELTVGPPHPVHDPATDAGDTNLAALFDQVTGANPSDYWLLTLNNTASCRRKFRVVRNPYARVAAKTTAMSRLYRLSRAPVTVRVIGGASLGGPSHTLSVEPDERC